MKREEYAFAYNINSTGMSGIITMTNPPTLVCYCDEENSKIILNALNPLPPAEGAEAILHRHIDKQSMDELSVNVWPDILEAMTEFAAQQQPTAEDAEEYIKRNHPQDWDDVPQWHIDELNDFATLHAQKLADKMVEERLIHMTHRCNDLENMLWEIELAYKELGRFIPNHDDKNKTDQP